MRRRRTSSLGTLVVGTLVVLTAPVLAAPDTAAATAEAVRGSARLAGERGKAPPLKPNLVALPAADISVQRSGTERKIRFESGLGNVGPGPIEVRPNRAKPCPAGKHHATQIMYRDMDGSGRYRRDTDTGLSRRSAGCMVFHRHHDHWHFEAASRYTLFQPSESKPVNVARRKMSFCLRDSRRLPTSYGTFKYPQHYGACSRYSPQGISVGWVDIYQSFLAGQAIRLPRRAEDGLYCLRTKVDPKNSLVESDDGDNVSVRAFRLEGDRIRYRDSRRCQ